MRIHKPLLLLAFLTACADEPAPPGSDAGAGVGRDAAGASDAAAGAPDAGPPVAIPASEIASARARALCDGLFRCPAARFDGVAARLYLVDAPTCVARIVGSPGAKSAGLEDLVADIAAGTVSYDGEAFAACLARYDSACVYSLAGLDPLELCADAFRGTRSMGAACHHSFECGEDAYCGGGSCPGSCMPRKPLGEVCDTDRECRASTRPGAWAECVGTCQERVAGTMRAAEGGPCGFAENAFELSTVTSTECASGLYCARDRSCRRPLAAGATCQDDDLLCDGAAFCDTTTSKCRAIVRGGVGAACPTDTPDFCDLSAGVVCGAGGQCVSAGGGAEGAPCERDAPVGFTTCGPTLRCTSAGSCAPRLALGEECSRGSDCLSNACECSDANCNRQVCAARSCE